MTLSRGELSPRIPLPCCWGPADAIAGKAALTHSPATASSSTPKPPNTSPASRSVGSRANKASPSSAPQLTPPESQTTHRTASHPPPRNRSLKGHMQPLPHSNFSASSPHTTRIPSLSSTSPPPPTTAAQPPHLTHTPPTPHTSPLYL